jgi:hypothetical protein
MQRYKAAWDDTYEMPSEKTVDLSFFKNEDLGYDGDDFRRVAELQIGQAVNLDGVHHVVTRIE